MTDDRMALRALLEKASDQARMREGVSVDYAREANEVRLALINLFPALIEDAINADGLALLLSNLELGHAL